jgi:hypothetical protein
MANNMKYMGSVLNCENIPVFDGRAVETKGKS